MTTTIDSDSVTSDPTSIDDTDSPYTTQGENRIEVDTTNGPVTVTLSSSDVVSGFSILIVDVGENAGTNNITINTEGSENINPGASSSITLSVDGTFRKLWSDGTNWFADTAPELSTVTADTGNITTSNNDVINVADTSTDPSSNGEIRVNGTDAKIQSGGVVQNLSNVNEGFDTTVVTSSTSTSGEDVIYADASGGPITITLSSSDVSNGNAIRVVNVEGSNAVTVDTEGAETIDPNAEASKTISNAGWGYSFVSDGTNWDASQAAEFESVSTGSLQYTEGYKSEEDDNSPFSESGSQSHTVSISGSYTKVILDFKKIVNDHGSAQDIEMQVDGIADPNYTYRLADGTTTTGDTEFVLSPGVESGGIASGELSFDGRISDSDDINVLNEINSGNEAIMTNGTVFNLPSGGPGDPIGQFTIKGSAGNIDVAGRIIGVTL